MRGHAREQAGMGLGPIPASGGGPSEPAGAVLPGVVSLDVAANPVIIRHPAKV